MSYQEYLILKERVEYLQHSQSLVFGCCRIHFSLWNFVSMSVIQMQVMFDQLCDLNRKEQVLQEANTNLRRQLISLVKQQDSISPKEKTHPCKLDSIYPAQLLGTMKPQKAIDSSQDGFENL
ncbi:hypothetical protein B296_00007389, partial [Ensete ventricosum]